MVALVLRLATVGLALEQKDCVAIAVGASGLVTVAVTAKRVALSQEPRV